MDYELAKKLKDAGFPNIRLEDGFSHTMGSHSDTRDSEPCYCNAVRYPTLSELIKACDKPFFIESNPEWCAGRGKGMNQIIGMGETPEEATDCLKLSALL